MRGVPVTLVALMLVLGVVGCSSSRYELKHDSGPDRDVDVSHIPNAVPRHEKRTSAGNKNPYTVLGKTYYLVDNIKGFKQRGIASWYGKKFHGHKTSNGETYNMYAMTAAHKTLPIPCYVRVTNLDNRRSVVVRINDRGPFHSGRIIDLSYAAAKRLGITKTGTGRVEIAVVQPGDTPPPPLKPQDRPATEADGIYVQVGAFSSATNARKLRRKVARITGARVIISEFQAAKPLYRVRIGPLANDRAVRRVRGLLPQAGVYHSHIVKD